uniref:Baeyer-Villiger monooxygenase dmxR6 n=1 Tax=Cryptosporiopsis sp. (strain 8999) TaxID=2572248 RepID=DMXR6_CRYX8|nr:RecName: Full=Baeyer-Villiger monooxygenase dmxR6; Short=BVMO dmxR6; AltName: Full=Dimeric xanthone biosynthesis cluster protein R6 [Cryptosporiopsis sp. 8999]QCL09097.1 DmxR6 [Cryptosporiopsis sp. 8999]
MAASPISLDPSHVGIIKVANIPSDSLTECNKLLMKNHEEYHMFFRDTAGHNHIVHSLLTILSLGASPKQLQDRYDDGIPIQRPIPKIDHELLEKLSDPEILLKTIGEITQYHTLLEFFKREIAAKGWKEAIQEYVLARTKIADTILARMYEGAYHPIIHLGLGIEFQQPIIVAEALAQAASHDNSNIGTLFHNAEAEAGISYPSRIPKPMIELINEVRANETIRTAPRWTDFGNKMRDGVVGRAGEAMASLAAQFRIRNDEEELKRSTAEMISTCAFFAGASQHEGRKKKIDFFYMHNVTSSLFFTVFIRQDWIKLEDRVRLVEWKARLDLAWYAVSGSAALDAKWISDYSNPASDGMGWEDLFTAVNEEHDDGHAAKFIRALKNGEQECSKYEQGEWADYFPMKGDMWLKLARMCQDTTTNRPPDLKWVPFTGFDQPWKRPDLAN